ncbi:MAG: hypothetical protein IJX98_02190 [Clostridia bacterium]|nr:hypothetical protein [Clostridia bacterium]
MRRTQEFDEWCDGASEEEVEAMIAATSKKFKTFLLISLIPIVNWVTMGCAIFCYNNLSFMKTRGKSNGNGLVRLVMMLYAFFIPPILVVQLCSKIEKLGQKVLGW